MDVIARVFASKTKYTPIDKLAFTEPPTLFAPEVDEVHVSCCFTWDKDRAEMLAEQWRLVCGNVKVGGPAYDDCGGEFTPGQYLRDGYIMTSRGCKKKCKFCFVPRREGAIRELAIHSGPWIVDNNLLACSKGHIESVFAMLESQKRIKFFGGIDAHLLKPWHVGLFARLRRQIDYLYIAYDSPRNKVSVESACIALTNAGFTQRQIGCFVLVAYDGDNAKDAYRRCEWVFVNGALPYPMYYRGPEEIIKRPKGKEWSIIDKHWSNPMFTESRVKKEGLVFHDKCLRGSLATASIFRREIPWM